MTTHDVKNADACKQVYYQAFLLIRQWRSRQWRRRAGRLRELLSLLVILLQQKSPEASIIADAIRCLDLEYRLEPNVVFIGAVLLGMALWASSPLAGNRLIKELRRNLELSGSVKPGSMLLRVATRIDMLVESPEFTRVAQHALNLQLGDASWRLNEGGSVRLLRAAIAFIISRPKRFD